MRSWVACWIEARAIRILLVGLSILIASSAWGQALTIREGDVLRIFAATPQIGPANPNPGVSAEPNPFSGEFSVQSDGAIYGVGFGRLKVAGYTVEGAQHLLRVAMRPFVKPEDVFLTLKTQEPRRVFIVGEQGVAEKEGSVSIVGRLGFRQALAGVVSSKDADLMEARIFRNGRQIAVANVSRLLDGSAPNGNLALEPDDVISIASVATVRIWVSGAVRNPGSVMVRSGTTVDEAIAEAGGETIPFGPDALALRSEYRVILRRGTSISEYPLMADHGLLPIPVEAGDTISLESPARDRVTVAGEVARPGEMVARPGTTLMAALAEAGGVTAAGSATDVLVYRNGEVLVVDAMPESNGQTATQFQLRDGDSIVVRKDERVAYVFGEVLRQGRVGVPAHKQFRATDALAAAGGLAANSSLRRIYLGRPGPDGKMVVTQFNLDEFLKDGKQFSNPVVKPGDILLFGQPKAPFLTSVSQILGSLLFINTIASTSSTYRVP
jgi:protein involved in polysaccharide export with SLBB domain